MDFLYFEDVYVVVFGVEGEVEVFVIGVGGVVVFVVYGGNFGLGVVVEKLGVMLDIGLGWNDFRGGCCCLVFVVFVCFVLVVDVEDVVLDCVVCVVW